VRLFVAAYPPAGVRDHFTALVELLSVGQPREPGRSVRLAPADHWHLTLAFLGDVPESDVDRACQAVERAVQVWRVPGPAVPVVRLAGGGTFGRGRFTTLWAGLAGDVAEVSALASAVRAELRRARLPYDRKPFRPHLTVARPGDRVDRADLARDRAMLDGYAGPPWPVERIRLVCSHLGPRPSYDSMYEACLTG
jgi:2'-5' RNA ligase